MDFHAQTRRGRCQQSFGVHCCGFEAYPFWYGLNLAISFGFPRSDDARTVSTEFRSPLLLVVSKPINRAVGGPQLKTPRKRVARVTTNDERRRYYEKKSKSFLFLTCVVFCRRWLVPQNPNEFLCRWARLWKLALFVAAILLVIILATVDVLQSAPQVRKKQKTNTRSGSMLFASKPVGGIQVF